MRSTTWRLFQKLANLMHGSLERAPVPVASYSPSANFRSFRNAGGRRARERMLGQRRTIRLMPRSQLRSPIRDVRNEAM